MAKSKSVSGLGFRVSRTEQQTVVMSLSSAHTFLSSCSEFHLSSSQFAKPLKRFTPVNSDFQALLRLLRISPAPDLFIFIVRQRQLAFNYLSALSQTFRISKPMSSFLRRTVLFGFCNVATNLVGFVGNPNVVSLRWFSSASNQSSFTVSYLMRELGFSQQSALKVSKRLGFDTSERPNKVIKLFRNYGFTHTQISSLLRVRPHLLVADTERTLLPKLEFFDAKGVSWPQFAKKLSSFPAVLGRSLDNQILPSYEFLRNFMQSDEKAIATVEKCPDILIVNVEKRLAPNIDILREHGVPHSNIVKGILRCPQAFLSSSDQYRKIVEEVLKMGFNAKRLNFVLAVFAFRCMSKSTWESKVGVYKQWGWSKEDVLKAFQSNTFCMRYSKEKIMASMDFFINRMGWRPSVLAKRPTLVGMSLEKRVVPRCSVFQVLLSKGLVEKEVNIHALLMVSEDKFLQKFIVPCKKEASKLLKLYKEKLVLSNGPVDRHEKHVANSERKDHFCHAHIASCTAV